MNERQALQAMCQRAGTLLRPPVANQLYVRVTDGTNLKQLGHVLDEKGYYLVTVAGTDERERVDGGFKLTYLFSHADEDLFLFVEQPLGGDRYVSFYGSHPAVEPFERELAGLMDLRPVSEQDVARLDARPWLHECYPPGLAPLRRGRTALEIREQIERHYHRWRPAATAHPPDGEWLLPVGPVHAGVIEPGRFLFRLAGEVVEALDVRLGYTHKGIERLFQSSYTLGDGWRLAEHVSGDSSFAHSLAYCRAAEALAAVRPGIEARLLRVLFLELERMANHVGDCGALALDVRSGVAAAELTALREKLLRLAGQLAGHRLLRGVNRPGGVVLPRPLDRHTARFVVEGVASHFADLAASLVHLPAFRTRLQGTGILTREQARCLGATGLVARASGLERDFRRQHPAGAYQDGAIRALLAEGPPTNAGRNAAPEDPAGDPVATHETAAGGRIAEREATAGDALARFLVRVREVAAAARIVRHLLDRPELDTRETRFVEPVAFQPARNFEFGLGYAEGWRGDVVYWLMQDKFGRIYRCKVRDPSMLNWPALRAAVEPHTLDEEYCKRYRLAGAEVDSALSDFPVINKSFNLSYSGNDL